MSYYSIIDSYVQRVKQSPYWELERLDRELDAAISQAAAEGNYKIIPELKALRRPLAAAKLEGRKGIVDGVDNDELLSIVLEAVRPALKLYGGYY